MVVCCLGSTVMSTIGFNGLGGVSEGMGVGVKGAHSRAGGGVADPDDALGDKTLFQPSGLSTDLQDETGL